MDRWFDTSAFVSAQPYSFGNGTRTEPNLRNPGSFSFDSVLSRWQPIRERLRLKFRAEFYNILTTRFLGHPTEASRIRTMGGSPPRVATAQP